MKIYGQTENITVREMTENDLEQFMDFLTERGADEDFTIEDIRNVWQFRNKKGILQYVIASADNTTVYGFCRALKSSAGSVKISAGVFEKYSGSGYEEKAEKIILG